LICKCLFLIFALGAHGALAPLSADKLDAQADVVVVGVVVASETSLVGEGEQIDRHVVLTATVETIEKGDRGAAGSKIAVHCWSIEQRPNGWSGNGGHGSIPVEKARFRAWLTKDADGKWAPLLPNGILILETPEIHGGSDEAEKVDPQPSPVKKMAPQEEKGTLLELPVPLSVFIFLGLLAIVILIIQKKNSKR